MIMYSSEEGFIKTQGIRNINGVKNDKNLKLPHIAIGVFSEKLCYDIVQKYECQKIGEFAGAGFPRPVYVLKYKDIIFTFFMAGISGPWISGDIEDIIWIILKGQHGQRMHFIEKQKKK